MSPTQPIGWVSWHAAIPICSFYGRSGYDRRLDHKSRMKRELPVRIREGLGVQFPRATRHKVRSFSCFDHFLCMAFAQLTFRDSLRDIETCLRAFQSKLYHVGFRAGPAGTT